LIFVAVAALQNRRYRDAIEAVFGRVVPHSLKPIRIL
jgi:hypothetical protein